MPEFSLNDVDPSFLEGRPIIFEGIGVVGGEAACQAVGFGAPYVILCDYDSVKPHNVVGPRKQVYRDGDIGHPKVEALAEILKGINPSLRIETRLRKIEAPEIYSGETERFVFCAFDEYDGRVHVRDSCFQSPDVALLIEQRLAPDAGHVFVLEPQNPYHQHRYSHPDNWKRPPPPQPGEEECGQTRTNMLLAKVSATLMMRSLWTWLLQERGSSAPVANDISFWLQPALQSNEKVWREEVPKT